MRVELFGGPDDGRVMDIMGGYEVHIPHCENLLSPTSEWWVEVYRLEAAGRYVYKERRSRGQVFDQDAEP